LFCFEHAGVVPDIIVMAKGLGSGMPISAIASTTEIMSKWKPGSHGGTYGGGALAASAAIATVQTMTAEDLPGNAEHMGQRLMDGLVELQGRYPVIGDVRGRGLMVATEFTSSSRQPDKTITKAVQAACVERKLLLLTCGSYENVIRWIPPLVVNEQQIDDTLTIFEDALRSVTIP
jgi:4-aminobutyrate aminotransferase-like enzyme